MMVADRVMEAVAKIVEGEKKYEEATDFSGCIDGGYDDALCM